MHIRTSTHCIDCICIMMRGGIYDEKKPEQCSGFFFISEHEGNPVVGAQRIYQGLRLYFTIHPDLGHITDILNFEMLTILVLSSLGE